MPRRYSMPDHTDNPVSAYEDKVPFLEYPSTRRDDPTRKQCLIYFIPGNPGLIAYYEPFLSALRKLLDEVEARADCSHAFTIYGRNLLGFDDGDHFPLFGTPTGYGDGSKTEPFSFKDIIASACDWVRAVDVRLPRHPDGSLRHYDETILIGHSVGAYIALEIFNHHHAAYKFPEIVDDWAGLKLKAGILLFPTISHIARSSKGWKLDFIRRTPILNWLAPYIAKGLVSLWPNWALEGILRYALRMPDHAVAATMRFLRSHDGILQALHMGRDEMMTITEVRWSDDLWQVQDVDQRLKQRTKFVFYYAKSDHWVDNKSRDEFIEQRMRDVENKLEFIIDQDDIPHAFCLSMLAPSSSYSNSTATSTDGFVDHSEQVAKKVKGWVENIADLTPSA